jgi:uncharacterized protein (DUF1810 family)
MSPPRADLDGSGPFDLARFLDAQADWYAEAVSELAAGCKRSHWMWFIFPQVEGLGASATSHHYSIKSLAEARAYLAHPVLGARLIECTTIVNRLEGRTARQIFGSPDVVKFRSAMTLFELASGPDSAFAAALEKYFSGERDLRTHELVGIESGRSGKGP